MSTISHHTMSLDGFIAGPDDSMDWAFAYGEPTSLADETMSRIGAILAGRSPVSGGQLAPERRPPGWLWAHHPESISDF